MDWAYRSDQIEGENKMYATLLVRPCDLVAPYSFGFRHHRATDLFVYIKEIQNICYVSP